MTKINIDLTAIKNSGKYRKAKNEHNYIDLIITERKEPDRDGNTLSVSISKTKEEREDNAATIYVGAGKSFNNPNQTAQPVAQAKAQPIEEANHDLPF